MRIVSLVFWRVGGVEIEFRFLGFHNFGWFWAWEYQFSGRCHEGYGWVFVLLFYFFLTGGAENWDIQMV